MRYSTLTLLALGLVGCSHVTKFSKPGATQQEFMKDRYECLKESRGQRSIGTDYNGNLASGSQYDKGMYSTCMSLRGYVEDSNGNLYPPKNAVVY